MNKEKSDDLIKKYLDADSTLEEEGRLFNTEYSGVEAWSGYVKNKRKTAPANLQSTIWKSIQKRKRRKQRFLTGISAVAASITLLMIVFFNRPNDQEISYHQKEVLLNEALSMFPEEQNTTDKRNIIYEDDVVIIYTALK